VVKFVARIESRNGRSHRVPGLSFMPSWEIIPPASFKSEQIPLPPKHICAALSPADRWLTRPFAA
jgi:hypothetical protein